MRIDAFISFGLQEKLSLQRRIGPILRGSVGDIFNLAYGDPQAACEVTVMLRALVSLASSRATVDLPERVLPNQNVVESMRNRNAKARLCLADTPPDTSPYPLVRQIADRRIDITDNHEKIGRAHV